MDQATPAQVEEVFALFNSLAGTNWTVEEVLSKRSINLGSPEREGQVLFIAQRLWWLDFGDVDFPVYASMQDEAERTASILELGREKPRLSFELQERRREHYPPLLILCKFVVTRKIGEDG